MINGADNILCVVRNLYIIGRNSRKKIEKSPLTNKNMSSIMGFASGKLRNFILEIRTSGEILKRLKRRPC